MANAMRVVRVRLIGLVSVSSVYRGCSVWYGHVPGQSVPGRMVMPIVCPKDGVGLCQGESGSGASLDACDCVGSVWGSGGPVVQPYV